MARRVLLVLAVLLGVGLVLLVMVPGAEAATDGVAVDIGTVTLSAASGGAWTASVSVTNTTANAKAVTISAPDCVSAPRTAVPGVAKPVTLTLPASCHISPGDAVTLRVRVGGTDAYVTVTAPASPAPTPEYDDIPVFLVAALVLSALAMVGSVRWIEHDDPDAHPAHGLVQGLDSTYSFDDSWATTLTSAAALVTGLFASSDILTGALGSTPQDRLTVMLLAGAISAGLAAAGVIVVKIVTDENGDPYAEAILAAAVLTLTGLLTQIGVVTWEARYLGLGWLSEWPVFVLGGCAAALAIAYGIAATRRTLKPPPDKADIPSDTLIDAAIAALGGLPHDPMDEAELSARSVQFARLLEQAAATPSEALTKILDDAGKAGNAADRSRSVRDRLARTEVPSGRRKRSAVL